MKRTISISVYVWKCWKITTNHLKLVRNQFTPKRPGKKIPWCYDDYALAIIDEFRCTERLIEKTNKFDRIKYDLKLRKLIQGIKNKYNNKK